MTTLVTKVKLPPSLKSGGGPAVRRTQYASERRHSLVFWVTLIGIFFPAVLLPLGGINITPGRLIVMLLLLPAIGVLVKRGRNRVISDFFAVALATWMLVSSYFNGGFRPYVGAEAVEFLGAYMVGRAFVFGPSNLRTFVKVLRQITVVVIALALLDVLSGRYVVMESFGIFSEINVALNHRMGLLRAASVFEGGEHYGTFCVAAAAIFFYSERSIRRVLYTSLTFVGCALSLSSGPLMGLGVITTIFSYDRILQRSPWRWKVLITITAGLMVIIFLIFDDPLERIIVHLTLDPQTGFFRIGTWNSALPLISESPFIGRGLTDLQGSGDAMVYLRSVDCVWLVEAIRYGLPAIILLILTMLAPILIRTRMGILDPWMHHAATGFSLAIVAIGLIGLTVHFWNAPWLFLSLCVGIRASIAEYEQYNRHSSRSLN